jgi:hypothetical protein
MELSSTLSLTSALDVVGGQRHAPAALLLGKTQYSLYRRLCGPQGRSRQVRKNLPPPGFDPWNVQAVASLLYRLSYPTHTFTCLIPYYYIPRYKNSPPPKKRVKFPVLLFIFYVCTVHGEINSRNKYFFRETSQWNNRNATNFSQFAPLLSAITCEYLTNPQWNKRNSVVKLWVFPVFSTNRRHFVLLNTQLVEFSTRTNFLQFSVSVTQCSDRVIPLRDVYWPL